VIGISRNQRSTSPEYADSVEAASSPDPTLVPPHSRPEPAHTPIAGGSAVFFEIEVLEDPEGEGQSSLLPPGGL